jgi:hypothetical protein
VLLEGRARVFRAAYGPRSSQTRGERGRCFTLRVESAGAVGPRRPVGARRSSAYLHARANERSPVAAARFAVRSSAEHVAHGRIGAPLAPREAAK